MLKTVLFTALAGFFAIYSAEPAAAAKSKGAAQSKVLGACERTQGCYYNYLGGGEYYGCSPVVCFHCEKKTCTQAIRPGHGATIGGIRLPPRPSRG